jgi:copper transport protein
MTVNVSKFERRVRVERLRHLAAFGLGLSAMSSVPTAAVAHAYVVATLPAENASLSASPHAIRVTFDEPVTLEAKRPIVVYDGSGKAFACSGSARLDPSDATSVICDISPTLTRGRYTVVWQVTSADTHPVRGSFAFGIDEIVHSTTQPIGETAYGSSSPLAAMSRYAMLLSIISGVGVLIFERAILKEFAGRDDLRAIVALRAWCRAFVRRALLLALVACIPAFILQTAGAQGTGLASALIASPTLTLESPWGRAWCLRVAVVLTMLGLGGRLWSIDRRIALVAAAALLLSFSISGHAMGGRDRVQILISVAADWCHLAGASLWSGGIVAFALGIPKVAKTAGPLGDDTLRRLVTTFTRLASFSVVAIVASGIYAAVIHISSVRALWSSWYGATTVLKGALLLPMLIFGWRSLLRGRGTLATRGLVWDTRGETVLLLAIIGLSAILTGLPPPHDAKPFAR